MTRAARARRTVRVTAIAVTALLAGLLPGSGSSAADGRRTRTEIGYACQLPSGAREITVALSGTFPTAGTAGTPIRPGALTAELSLPHDALGELFPSGTRTVRGTAALTGLIEGGLAST